jgi:hypothetical protein
VAAPDRTAAEYRTILEGLVGRANQGDAVARAELARFLDDHPEVVEACGDLGKVAERAWVHLIVGDQVLGAEVVTRHVEALKADLLGPHATRIEQILAEDIVLAYLAARHAEVSVAQPGSQPLGVAAFRVRRCESAQRRLQRALATLALLRAKLPAGLAPRDTPQLYAPEGRRHA